MSEIKLTLNLENMTPRDIFALKDIIYGVGPEGSLIDAAPGFGTGLGYKLDQALKETNGKPENAQIKLVVDEKAPDDILADLLAAWDWLATWTGYLRQQSILKNTTTVLESIGSQLIPEITRRVYETECTKALLEGKSFKVGRREIEKMMSKAALVYRRRAKQCKRQNSNEHIEDIQL